MRLIAAIAAAAVLAGLTAQDASACERSDIAILQSNWRIDGRVVRVAGELKNGCATDTAVQLQAIYRKESGEIVHVSDFWPAVTNNIRAGETFGFSTLEPIASQGVAKVDVKVIAVRQWTSR